ncbi:MAG: saccharopine dehydrogenase NADP-binding domain-containing protein [Marinobacter sp.]|uniref:saccharopine dehydrogenase family protein n=1 Tax=Marinobacter sp. TaxID=50741 RepID=UPI00299ED331|nr:saccharopine dehydrogenase NADP-binding domain-containing protein [Marinobacter sp.]MDX1755034.1 saccharopine dehydrogenase NADP-binding domain-containing protein [Marinobacter sp.]
MTDQQYDVVVFGATSFVGQILCRYLHETYGCGQSLNWAIAGRSEGKLEQVKAAIGAPELPAILADAGDPVALENMCRQTRVVVSTVGPYALYGEPLIQACVAYGTDYCDLTGEVQWIRQMIGRYEDQAKASGARIVHCCGFDSIPSDLGVWFLQEEAVRLLGTPCRSVKMRVKAAKGGFSGGTVASLMNVAKEAIANPDLRKELANPFSLCPSSYTNHARQPNVKSAEYDADFRAWLAPFVMAAVNTRIVQRTNALTGAYGQDFLYDEAMITGKGLAGRATAYAVTAAIGGFLASSAVKPTRWVLEKFVVPKPGEGPSPEDQQKGFYDLRFVGRTDDGQTLRTKVVGDRDPGYGSTSKMLGEAASCLAFDISKEEVPGGFWTPASIFGEKLLERLTSKAGLTFEVLDAG